MRHVWLAAAGLGASSLWGCAGQVPAELSEARQTYGEVSVSPEARYAREPLARMVREGLFGVADSALGRVPSRVDMEVVFWFMLWGVVTFMLGHLVAWVEGQGRRLPAAIGWELVIMNLAALVFYPKGGFWLVLIPAFLIIWESRRAPER